METMICTSKIVSQRNGTESYPILLDSSLTIFNRIIQNTRNFEMYRAFPFSVYRFTDISPPPPPLSVFHFNDDHPHCARGKSLSNGNSSTVFPFSPPLVRSNGREHFSISASRFSIDDETKKGRKERKLRGRKLSSHPRADCSSASHCFQFSSLQIYLSREELSKFFESISNFYYRREDKFTFMRESRQEVSFLLFDRKIFFVEIYGFDFML